MLSWELLICIIVLALVATYWRAALIVKERAEQAARLRAERFQVQFLDESIALQSVRLARDTQGRLRFLRRYQFEFTATGSDRAQGEIVTLGAQVVSIDMGAHRIH